MNILYYAGRIFQVIGLIALPSSIWVGQIGHSEKGSIAILVASLLVFAIGTLLLRLSNRAS